MISKETVIGIFASAIVDGTIPLDRALAFLGSYADFHEYDPNPHGYKWLDNQDFPTWRTIDLGTHKTVKDLENSLRHEGCEIYSGWARRVMEGTTFALNRKNIQIHLVKVSVADLGFIREVTIEEVYAQAQKFGLQLCPPEVGPQLRLQYKGKLYLRIAMEAIADSQGHSDVFAVHGVDSKLRLGSGSIFRGAKMATNYLFVFSRLHNSPRVSEGETSLPFSS